MADTANLEIGDQKYSLNLIKGTEQELAVDISKLRKESRVITFDDGYGNTGSCESEITFIDGDKGILRYRGYDIAELAEKSNFLESAYLLLNGNLPSGGELDGFRQRVAGYCDLPAEVLTSIRSQPAGAHPMAVLSSGLQALGGSYPQYGTNDRKKDLESFDESSALIISAVRSLAAAIYKNSLGEDLSSSDPGRTYCENFLSMMFDKPGESTPVPSAVESALDLIFLLHADHEQNCSTSTCRMIASGGANPFASLAGGVSALWGPLHGGANMAVIKMLDEIHESGDDGSRFVESAKQGKSRLMGFGHRVYRNYDPRAKILKNACDQALDALGVSSPILQIARRLEEVALEDPYFIQRKLYPNVDFYSGIILQALGFPTNMFTVLFAIGRTPGWLSHWKEIAENGKKIHRPRQIYQGETLRPYLPVEDR
ncbi:MAG: citrate synthase [Opitutae bacterium]|jgi:citrate synthase|nr:citrate synthase [Opitutae bacterium]